MKVNGLNKEIILVLLLNRSFDFNIRGKCISVLLNAIYSCSRKSSDNWLCYVTSYGHNNGIIIRSNLMPFESVDYQKYLFSSIVDNKISVDVSGIQVSLLHFSRSNCICGSIGEKFLSFALMTRSVTDFCIYSDME